MRILFLTQWFDPEPTFKGLLFAKALRDRGHSVEVLTGFPNYPGGKLYPGYKLRLWKREVMEGIPILRVALYPSHSRSALGRVLNYLSFALSASIVGILLVKPADVAYVYHPPATVGLPALCLKVLRGMPFLYDVQDLWPDSLAATGMVKQSVFLKLIDIWCRWVYRLADRIVVLSPGFKNRLMERGVPVEKITVIYNWSYPAAATPPDPQVEQEMAGKFVLLFAGNLGAAQGLGTVLDAARLMKHRRPEVCFAFAGSGLEEDRLRHRVAEEALSNVIFLGRRPPEAMGALYARADALLVHLRDDPLFTITIPSKTQAYLAAGKPIVMAVRGDAADLIREAKAGVICEPENPELIVRAIEEIVALPQAMRRVLGANGRLCYERQLSLSAGVESFEREFRKLATLR